MEEKKLKEFKDTVFLQNLTNLLWEYMLAFLEAKEAQVYMCKEMDKFKQIQEKEKARSKACMTADVGRSLLELSDHIVRIKNAASKSQNIQVIIEGMEMVSTELEKALISLSLEKISPIGELFDPHLHELGGMLSMPEVEENRIIEVVRDGFKCGEQWIRHPLVVVNQHKK